MKQRGRLNSQERKVFELLNKAIISNPFDETRAEILKKILDILQVKIKRYPVLFDDVFTEIRRMIGSLKRRGFKQIQDFLKR